MRDGDNMILSNIVFLDIDGVLNSLHCSDDIDEQKLPLLKRILDENNAQVVLSSTWRSLEGVDNPECQRLWSYLVDTLARYDISIVSKTPVIFNNRPLEIKTWLEGKDNVKWISIEDDFGEENYQGYGIGGHLVQTEFFTDNINDGGLQEKHVRLAKKLFDSQ